jgi:NAD+ diphosphatase
MKTPFVPLLNPPAGTKCPVSWFAFNNKKMLVRTVDCSVTIPLVKDMTDLGLHPVNVLYLGLLDSVHCFACNVPDQEAPEGMEFRGLRALFGRLDTESFSVALRALHLVEWDRFYRYCTACGTSLVRMEKIRAKECPKCAFIAYPRISPAVIVLVEREDRILLARAVAFEEEMYSVLAGFVEPGEALEDTVRREVREETGIDVKEIKYFGSQPWPFPDSLMIGFVAQYAGGEIEIDREEIRDARWFTAENLPTVPGKMSIARELIDWFIEKQKACQTD